MDNWMELIISVAAGLATAIPLVIKLVEYVRKSIQERNWLKLVNLVMGYMAEAEQKFENGATRREWVLGMVAASAEAINYDVDLNVVGEMIDNLCDMSKVVNAPVAGTIPAE